MSLRKLVCLPFLMILLASMTFAQSSATGDLHVTVKDPKGSVVTNATVTARDQSKAFERSTTSNTDGEYRLLSLPPGNYTVAIEAPGFAKATATDVTITVGQLADLPIAMKVSGTEEVVTVSSEAALVETQRSSSTDTINQRRIENLPINGRNYINFALTDSRLARDDTPNIGVAPTSGLNIGGQRARSNLVNVDGANAVDNSTNGIRSTVSQEAVQEFQIQTNSFAAEYGQAVGGVVNIITKSGSNDLHGSAFGFLRNRAFQAVNPFSTVSDPAYTRVQAGIALGGAIKKNKTFYFFSYEGTWRQETGFSSIGADGFGLRNFDATGIFNPLAPPGTFSIQATPEQIQFLEPFAAAGPAPEPIQFYTFLVGAASGVALTGQQPASFALLPLAPPGSGPLQFGTSCNVLEPICLGLPESFVKMNSLIGNFPISEDGGLYSLRLDHNFTSNNHLMLRGGVSPNAQTGIQVQAQGPQNFGQNAFSRTSNQDYHDWSITAQDQLTMGSDKVNTFMFQYARRGLLYGFSHGVGGENVAVNIPGFAFFGREPFSYVNRTEQRYQVADSMSWTKGSHNMKFGVEGNFLPITANFTVNFGGIYNFGQQTVAADLPSLSPVQAYGAGIPSNFVQGVGNPHDAFSNTTAGVFAQDSWRIKSNLTLNYGLRYDVEFTPQFSALNSIAAFGEQTLGITQGIPRDYNNVAPRIGIAWDPYSDGKSTFRASYGIFYGHPLLGLAFIADVADGSQAPQLIIGTGAPGVVPGDYSPATCPLNASNTFQGLLGLCLPASFNYLPNRQRFNPNPNAPSIFTNQNYLSQGIPLGIQPFGFPNASNFVYDYANQVNFAYERDLGHNYLLTMEYNFVGGRHLNRPINLNTVKSNLLINNWRAALADDGNSHASTLGPLGLGSQSDTLPCGVGSAGPWVTPALVSFFRPSGYNPALMGVLAPCLPIADAILQADGIRTACDPSANFADCIPFSDEPTNVSNGSSVYHALTVNLRKRFSEHYEFLASYTWSHAIDDSTDLESPLEPQDNYNPNADRSNSLFDQRHRFVFSGVYQSGVLSGGGFTRRFFSNWTVAPLIEAVSGRPFNIIVGDDRNYDFSTGTDRPLIVPAGTGTNSCGDQAAASQYSPTGFLQPACFLDGTLIGTMGRNAGTKPYNLFVDLGISKAIPLSERFTLIGRVDMFNIINKYNISDVNPLWNTGQPATAAFDPRQFQFGLKVQW